MTMTTLAESWSWRDIFVCALVVAAAGLYTFQEDIKRKLGVSACGEECAPQKKKAKTQEHQRHLMVGRKREEVVERQIREKRGNVFLKAPTLTPEKIQEQEAQRKAYPKSEDEREFILTAMRENYVFSSLTLEDAAQFVDFVVPLDVPAGTDIIVQGDPADYFYIIKTGAFTALQGLLPVGHLGPGQSFGETGLLYHSPRNATVRADVASSVWRLDRDTFRYMFSAAVVAPNSAEDEILSMFSKTKVLSNFDTAKLRKLAKVAAKVEYEAGQMIYEKGDEGSLGYFVLSGKVRITDLPTDNMPELTLSVGRNFGLQAVDAGQTRQTGVQAVCDCEVVALAADDVREILGESASNLFLHAYQINRLQCVPLFEELSDETLDAVITRGETQRFDAGHVIIEQGTVGDKALYLIEQGQCQVVHKDDDGKSKIVSTLGPTQYFGEMSLVTDGPRSANVIALTDCQVLVLKKEDFDAIFGTSSTFAEQLHGVAMGRRHSLQRVQHPLKDITMERLDRVQLLGSGTFGVVSLVKDKKTSLEYAMKAMSIEFIENHKQENNIVGEKQAMMCCDHPFILKLYATFRDQHRIYFVLEYCNGGELFNVLHNKDHDSVPEGQAKFYAACETLALEHLSLQSMAYRDLKPENTLVDMDGYLKMIDMGFAKVIKGRSYTFCGTPEYLAPEIILGTGHNRGVDYFALGVLIYEMISGQTPFYDYSTESIFKKIVRGKFRFGGEKFTPPIQDLITKLLSPDPGARLGMLQGGVSDISGHDWFSDIDFHRLLARKIEAPWKPAPKDPESDPPVEDDGDVSLDETFESNGAWLENF